MKRWIGAPLYYALQIVRREPLAAALEEVRRTEFLSMEEMRSLRAERQLAQLRFAVRHVPWYQQTCARWISDINGARGWNDATALMRELPVIDRDDVASNPDAFRPLGIPHLRTYPDKTSGSSGTPFTFPCDQRAWAYRHAVVFRCMESFGVRVGEPYALFFGLHWNPKIRLISRIRDVALNRVRISAYDIDPRNLDRHLRAIEGHRPAFFFGYPSAIYDFCVLLRDRGLDLTHLRLKAVFLTAEPLLPHHRSLIVAATGSRCVDLYGSAEGGTTAFECPSGSLHIATETVWLQLREPDSLQGEAVVTDMMLRAFPLLRYVVGDEVVLKEGVCECGRPHPMLLSVRGRCGDPIVLPNGRRINANLPSYIFKPPYVLHAIRRYRFVQAQGSPLELQIVVSKSFREEHLAILREETLAAFGKDVPLSIRIVESLPHLPNAKHRDFVHVDSE